MLSVALGRVDDICEIIFDNPPVNAIGASVRQGLRQALEEASANRMVRRIIIRGRDAVFSGGADIREFSAERAQPHLPEICNLIERSEKPVLAAIRGACLGGAMEVALACHYRAAAPSARLGLPEVTLGLMPGAGGTQRLPRLIPMDRAVDLIISGRRVDGGEAAVMGIVDRLLPEDEFYDHALAYARSLPGPRRTGERPVLGDASMLDAYFETHADVLRGLVAPASCIAGLRAAFESPLAEALEFERSLFNALTRSPQAQALRDAFLARRVSAKADPGLST